MAVFYSAATGQFYRKAAQDNTLPVDSIEIPTEEEFITLLEGKAAGRELVVDQDSQTVTLAAEADSVVKARYMGYAQTVLEEAAQGRGYDSIISVCSYANSTNPTYAAEATAAIVGRDNVWTTAFLIYSQVLAGEIPLPTKAEFLSMLPAIEWPE